jgi:hypothetical protein
MHSTLRGICPIAGRPPAKAWRLGEIEGAPEKRAGEAERGEPIARGVAAGIPSGDDVVGQRPALVPASAARRARSAATRIEMKPSSSLGGNARVEAVRARPHQPRRQSAELFDGDRRLRTRRKRKGQRQGCGARATQNEPATADGRHHVVPDRKCPDHYASHLHRRQQKNGTLQGFVRHDGA